MTKPFKLTQPPGDPGVVRAPDGKFARVVPPSPPEIVRRSSDQGIDVAKIVADNRAPEHPIPKGAPQNEPNEIPWGPAGRYNDANRPPMRLR